MHGNCRLGGFRTSFGASNMNAPIITSVVISSGLSPLSSRKRERERDLGLEL